MKVSFIGHRKIANSQHLIAPLKKVIEALIIEKDANIFYFGSRSEFDDVCLKAVSQLKEKYPHIKRVFVRAEYEYIGKSYRDYLLTFYDDTFFPEQAKRAGVLSYIKRNQVMVDACDVLIVYCDEDYMPTARTKSGTKIAVEYAKSKDKVLINVFDMQKSIDVLRR